MKEEDVERRTAIAGAVLFDVACWAVFLFFLWRAVTQ